MHQIQPKGQWGLFSTETSSDPTQNKILFLSAPMIIYISPFRRSIFEIFQKRKIQTATGVNIFSSKFGDFYIFGISDILRTELSKNKNIFAINRFPTDSHPKPPSSLHTDPLDLKSGSKNHKSYSLQNCILRNTSSYLTAPNPVRTCHVAMQFAMQNAHAGPKSRKFKFCPCQRS